MDIPEIVKLPTSIEMRREILKLALERNLSEERIWEEFEIYRKTHTGGRKPIPISSILICNTLVDYLNILERLIGKKIKITESPIEDLLTFELQKRNIKFEIQKKIGRYRVDFFFPKANLIIEVDGKEYHSTSEQREKDMKRQMDLIKKGYTVLRFRGSEIFRDVENCVIKISKFLGRK